MSQVPSDAQSRPAGRWVPPAQRQFWFLDQLTPQTPRYNVCRVVRLDGPLDLAAVRDSLREIERRHEVLRSTFGNEGGEPVLRITPWRPLTIPLIDLTDLPGDARLAESGLLIREHALRPFDLRRGPLMRAALVRESPGQHRLLLSLHHIVTDGWSMIILVEEFLELYSAHTERRPAGLPPLALQYPEVVARQERWRANGEYERQLRYWRARLGDLTDAALPPDLPAGQQPERGAAMRKLCLDQDLPERLRAFARAETVTLFMVLLSAFKITLARHLDSADVVVGTFCATREDPQAHTLIGPFLNMLTLRTDLSGAPTVRQVLSRVRRTCLEAYDHQDISFEDVVAELSGQPRTADGNPLVHIVFQLVDAQRTRSGPHGLTVAVEESQRVVLPKFGLAVDVVAADDELRVLAEYDSTRYQAETIDALLREWQTVLHQLPSRPDSPITLIRLTTPEEDAATLAAARGAVLPPSGQASVLDGFESQAELSPTAPAVVSGTTRLTYGDLEQAANRLAHRLREAGAGPESRVGIFLERSAQTIVSVLAVWKAGAAYVPIDLDSPPERRRAIIRDADLTAVITLSDQADELADGGLPLVLLDRVATGPGQYPATRPPRAITGESLCYVAYTSGSAGQPKGVMATHGGLLHIQRAWEHAFQLRGRITAHAQMASFSFDGFLGELVRCLGSGAALVICPREILLQSEQLHELMRRERVDVADFVPLVLRTLVAHVRRTGADLGFLSLLIVGSDTFPADELAGIQPLAGRSAQVVNCYGLTEGTIDSTYFVASPGDRHDRAVLIGRPLPGTEAYILDEALRPVPPGVAGTLFIAGPTLTRGYLAAPGLTAGSFPAHPLSGESGKRMYRTGDRARYLRTSRGPQIEFLGRRDRQVKIRGYRVELGEVEAAFRQTPGVKDVAVTVSDGDPAERRLLAYVVPARPPSTSDWRRVVRASLPPHMVPERIILLAELPMTAHGKVDRAALAATAGTEAGPQAPLPPRTHTERRLAGMWSEVLGREGLGVHDDFFVSGGNSLLVMRFIALIQEECGVTLSVRTFFQASTIAGLAAAVDQRAGQAAATAEPMIMVARELIEYQEEEEE